MSNRQKSNESDKFTKKTPTRKQTNHGTKNSRLEVEKPDESTNDEKVTRARKQNSTPVDLVIAKYTEFGWTLMRPPKGSINDLVAQKNRKFHFIQVVTPETIDGIRFQGVPQSDFIQNALSNNAIPVYAHVVSKNTRTDQKITVTFQDINTNARVIVGGRKKAVNNNRQEESGSPEQADLN